MLKLKKEEKSIFGNVMTDREKYVFMRKLEQENLKGNLSSEDFVAILEKHFDIEKLQYIGSFSSLSSVDSNILSMHALMKRRSEQCPK